MALATVAALAATGCMPVSSSHIETSSLYGDFRAGLGGRGVGVSAQLKTSPSVSPDVRLSAGDPVVAYAEGQKVIR